MRKSIIVLALIVAGCGSNPVSAPVDFDNNTIKTVASLAYDAGRVNGMCELLKQSFPERYEKSKDDCGNYKGFEAFWATFKVELDRQMKETK